MNDNEKTVIELLEIVFENDVNFKKFQAENTGLTIEETLSKYNLDSGLYLKLQERFIQNVI